jgi:hypothetical protein
MAGAATVVSAAAAVFAFGMVAFWSKPIGADKMWAHTPASVEHRGTEDTGSYDEEVYVRLAPSELVLEVWPGHRFPSIHSPPEHRRSRMRSPRPTLIH